LVSSFIGWVVSFTIEAQPAVMVASTAADAVSL
jgi:hypothetical protein